MIFSKLSVRLNIVTFSLLVIISVLMVCAVNYFQKQYALTVAEKKSLIFLQHNLAIHSYFNNQLKPKIFALTDGSRDKEFFDPVWMSSSYAVREIEKIYDKNSGYRYYYKEAAINARSPQNEADDFERDFIQRLNKDPNLQKLSGVRTFDGKPYFYTLMRGESLEKGCMRCHSTHDKAPGDLLKTYGTTRSFNRLDGDVVSAFSIHIPLSEAYGDADRLSIKLSVVLLSILFIVFVIQNRLISRLVLVPLKNIRSQAESISNDIENLGVSIPEIYSQEMNEIVGSFNKMSYRLKTVVDDLDRAVKVRTADLTESEARYRSLFEHMTNGFALHELVCDTHGNPSDYRFVEVNPSFEKLTGLKASDIVSRTVLEVMPNTEMSWIETYGRVALNGEPVSFESFSQELSCHYQVWAYCPKPGFFATIFSDITVRKNASESLILSEKRLKEAQRIACIGNWELKLADKKLVWSDEIYRIFEINPNIAGVTYESFLEAVHPDDREAVKHAYAASLRKKIPYEITHRLLMADGRVKYVLERLETTFDLLGQPLCSVGTVQDITREKLAEEEKAKLELQLHQAQKMESVGSLAGGVAHDFNNKLSVILGCTYLACNETDPAQLQKFLEEIRKAAEQSADLTRQLLAFARKQTIVSKVLNLNETVSGMLKMLNRLIGEDIFLIWRPVADLWLLKFDPSQIDQILANLCVNARDSITENGTITIETGNCVIGDNYCSHHAEILPGEYVRLVVSDNGCGMDSGTLSHIFEPFFTTKETGKGTGLGLATVFGIVKQNNGFIDVYSEPYIGTTFTIHLPRHVGTSIQPQDEGVMMSAPRGRETILLVEDELAILTMASMILTKQGYAVVSANSPAEAHRLAKEHVGDIQLLITDVIMPEMNGKDLAVNMQSFRPQLKCLFMSGYTADAISRHGVLDEGVNFIQKPFSLPDLACKVREVLDSP